MAQGITIAQARGGSVTTTPSKANTGEFI